MNDDTKHHVPPLVFTKDMDSKQPQTCDVKVRSDTSSSLKLVFSGGPIEVRTGGEKKGGRKKSSIKLSPFHHHKDSYNLTLVSRVPIVSVIVHQTDPDISSRYNGRIEPYSFETLLLSKPLTVMTRTLKTTHTPPKKNLPPPLPDSTKNHTRTLLMKEKVIPNSFL
jgi:hypothetical protein